MKGRAFHLPIPVGFETLDAVTDLCDRLGPVALGLVVLLWQRRHRSGELVRGENAGGSIEALVRWPRARRGHFAAAVLASGLVEKTAAGLRIRDPWELGSVEWMGGRFDDEDVAPEITGLSDEERQRKYEAARKAIRRDKALSEGQKAAALDSLRVRFGVGQASGQNRTAPGHEPDTSRTNVRAESDTPDKERVYAPATGTLTGTAPEDSFKNTSAGSAAGASGPGPAIRHEHEGNPSSPAADNRPPAQQTGAATEAQVTEVLEHWRTACDMPDADITTATEAGRARRKRIRDRLKGGATVEKLKRAADNVRNDSWLSGRKPGSPKGGYRDVKTVFRDAEQVDRLARLTEPDDARGPPGRLPSYRDSVWTPELLREQSNVPADWADGDVDAPFEVNHG